MSEEKELFNNVEELAEITNTPATPDIPRYYDEGWHDYVMGHFVENELENGHPTCDGLRRVTEKLIGPIVERKITQLVPLANFSDNSTGAVAVRVIVTPRSFSDFERREIIEESVSDINKANTPDAKYYIHPLAVAETRSEARCLRKVLRLRKIIAAEEVSEVDESKLDELISFQPDDPISEEQINALDIMCSRLDMNVMDYINAGKRQYDNVYQLSKQKTATILGYLNKVQRSVVEKPKCVRGYDPNWKGK